MEATLNKVEAPSSPRRPGVMVLPVTPILNSNLELTRQIFDAFAKTDLKALVLVGYGTGTTPDALNPFILETTQRNVPVFILSSNYGDDHGVRKIKYEPQAKAAESGAIHLRDVNVRNLEEVINTIQGEIDKGIDGQNLAELISQKYGIPDKPGLL